MQVYPTSNIFLGPDPNDTLTVDVSNKKNTVPMRLRIPNSDVYYATSEVQFFTGLR